MKKIIFTLFLCITITGIAKAECWGTSFNGTDGHSYCISNQGLKWHAALGWCAAQGRHLASLNEACDYGTQIYGKNTDRCPNNAFDIGVYIDSNGKDLRDYGRVWTANSYDNGARAKRIDIGRGSVAADFGGDHRSYAYPALCY